MPKLWAEVVNGLGWAWAQASYLSTSSTDRSFGGQELPTSLSTLTTGFTQSRQFFTQPSIDDNSIFTHSPHSLLELRTNLLGVVIDQGSKFKSQRSIKYQLSAESCQLLVERLLNAVNCKLDFAAGGGSG